MDRLALEPITRRRVGDILRFVIETGGLDKRKIGRIELQGPRCLIEVPESWRTRLVEALDGALLKDRPVRAWIESSGVVDGHRHFKRLRAMLEMEAKGEAEQIKALAATMGGSEAEGTGRSLVGMIVQTEEDAIGGFTIVRFAKRREGGRLPWTLLRNGAPILVSREDDGDEQSSGLVIELKPTSIRVAIHELPEGDGDSFRIDLSKDEVSLRRQRSALDRADSARGDRLAKLVRVLTGDVDPEFSELPELRFFNQDLNEPQREAVRFAQAAHDLAILHGPPGTGKTTTVVEMIRQAVKRKELVLACAPSHMAVDNIFSRLIDADVDVVRLGHPARVQEALRKRTLSFLVEKHEDVRRAKKLRREAKQLLRKAGSQRRAAIDRQERDDLRREARLLFQEARDLERGARERVLDSARVICSTLTGLDSLTLGKRKFDLVVIDEACQSTEPGCWIPIQRSGRVVLAGDHCQLPPTIIAPEAERAGFGVSMQERLIDLYGTKMSRRLVIQYRMNEAIMAFPSEHFYDGELVAHESVRTHRLCELPGIEASLLTETVLRFIDTAGSGHEEEKDGTSRRNPGEAELVRKKVEAALAEGIPAADVAVISPYAAQVRWIRKLIEDPGVEVDSVDGFQGREKELIIISLVRSNSGGKIGFLSDTRRMNVALTRARRQVIVIGDSATISGDPFYQALLDEFELRDAYGSIWEEMD